jgi:hypothetical protein
MWNVSYVVDGIPSQTIAEAYASRATERNCVGAFGSYAGSGDLVVETCDADGNCLPSEPGTIAAEELECGELDDVAAALIGMHPSDVWLTRLEGDLPRSALESDLLLRAGPQEPVENRFVATKHINHACDQAGGASPTSISRKPPSIPGGWVTLALAALFVGGVTRRVRAAAAARA